LKSDRSSVPCHYLNRGSLALLPHRFHQHIVEFHHMHCRWQYILQNCDIQTDTGCNDGLKQTENIYVNLTCCPFLKGRNSSLNEIVSLLPVCAHFNS
jgi:hypothetical protein